MHMRDGYAGRGFRRWLQCLAVSLSDMTASDANAPIIISLSFMKPRIFAERPSVFLTTSSF